MTLSPAHLEVIAWFGAALALFAFLVSSIKTIRYRITRKFLIISWLGLPVRWFRLSNIAHVTPERFAWAEPWFNAFRTRHRILTIHRRRGIFRRICISPTNRFVFRAELNRARGVPERRLPQVEHSIPGRHVVLENSVL
jgi:hypothetical protein